MLRHVALVAGAAAVVASPAGQNVTGFGWTFSQRGSR